MSSALSVSSDDFFYNLGYLFYAKAAQYGPTPIQDQAAQYSLGQLTGIDLPGEVAGRVDSQPERMKLHAADPKAFPNTTWYTGENIEMAFGQGGTYITPIEQAVAYSTFANGGTRYAPQVAAAVVSPSGKVVKRFAPQVTGHVAISPANHQAMLAGFEGVVTSPDGTAYGVPGPGLVPRRGGRQDGHGRHRGGQGADRLVRGVRPGGRPPVRGGRASSTRPATGPRRRPRWWLRSSTTWPPTRSPPRASRRARPSSRTRSRWTSRTSPVRRPAPAVDHHHDRRLDDGLSDRTGDDRRPRRLPGRPGPVIRGRSGPAPAVSTTGVRPGGAQ